MKRDEIIKRLANGETFSYWFRTAQTMNDTGPRAAVDKRTTQWLLNNRFIAVISVEDTRKVYGAQASIARYAREKGLIE